MSIVLHLPLPPTTNGLYANASGKGRIKTAEYRAWIIAAGVSAKAQSRERVTGPYEVTVSLPSATRGDIDNRLKACLDLLVSLQITPDDRRAQKVTAQRVPGIALGAVVEIREVAA